MLRTLRRKAGAKLKSLLVEFKGSRLDAAIVLAIQYHAGQVDKAGVAYILHPLRVMNNVANEGEETMIAAVLHDAVEDTDLTLEYVRVRFGVWVANTVDALTRRHDETYKEFIRRISKHEAATKIKIADLNDNLSRLVNLPLSEAAGLGIRYADALQVLGAQKQELK